MLFSEFQIGTGCKDNPYNHQLYRELEIIYMNTDCTKQHIYDMGKKLMDNSKSEEQIRFEMETKANIAEHKEAIKEYKANIEIEKRFTEPCEEYMHYCKDMIKYHKEELEKLKWILG